MKYPSHAFQCLSFLFSFLLLVQSPSSLGAFKKSPEEVKLPGVGVGRAAAVRVPGAPRATVVAAPAASGSDDDHVNPECPVRESSPDFDRARVVSVPGPDETFSEAASSVIVDQLISSVNMSVPQFRAFLNLLPSAVVVAGRAGKIALVNDAATRFFGYSIREMEGFLGATALDGAAVRGMQVTALMPPEIGFVHHRFMQTRQDSGEQRISRIPRPVVVKIRRDPFKDPIDHRKFSEDRKKFSELMYVKSWYTQDEFMTAENKEFTPQEGFKYISASMSLGEIKLGGEPFYVAFFDTSIMDRRRASVATRIAADVVGDAGALSHLTRGESDTFSKMFPNVVMIMVDIVGSTAKIKDQPVQEIFRDLNSLFGDFDQIVSRYPEAVKVKTTGDGYILGVGLTCTGAECPSLEERAMASVKLAGELAGAAKRHTLCGHPVEVRVGAHLGPVMGGILGSTKKVFDVLGSTVSIAARMESTGVPGKVQISKELRAALSAAEKLKFDRHENTAIRSSEYTGETYLSK